MTRKVMDIRTPGCHLICLQMDDKYNPYHIYTVCGSHRKQLTKYADFVSVASFIRDFYVDGMDARTTTEVLWWVANRSC